MGLYTDILKKCVTYILITFYFRVINYCFIKGAHGSDKLRATDLGNDR